MVSFAVDTFVMVQTDTWSDIKSLSEKVIGRHIIYLKHLGMTVNESKTEIMLVGKSDEPKTIEINNTDCVVQPTMKALGIALWAWIPKLKMQLLKEGG